MGGFTEIGVSAAGRSSTSRSRRKQKTANKELREELKNRQATQRTWVKGDNGSSKSKQEEAKGKSKKDKGGGKDKHKGEWEKEK